MCMQICATYVYIHLRICKWIYGSLNSGFRLTVSPTSGHGLRPLLMALVFSIFLLFSFPHCSSLFLKFLITWIVSDLHVFFVVFGVGTVDLQTSNTGWVRRYPSFLNSTYSRVLYAVRECVQKNLSPTPNFLCDPEHSRLRFSSVLITFKIPLTSSSLREKWNMKYNTMCRTVLVTKVRDAWKLCLKASSVSVKQQV